MSIQYKSSYESIGDMNAPHECNSAGNKYGRDATFYAFLIIALYFGIPVSIIFIVAVFIRIKAEAKTPQYICAILIGMIAAIYNYHTANPIAGFVPSDSLPLMMLSLLSAELYFAATLAAALLLFIF